MPQAEQDRHDPIPTLNSNVKDTFFLVVVWNQMLEL